MRALPRAARLLCAVVVAAAAPLTACADLHQIEPNACGNSVIDGAKEDCDTFPIEPNTACGAAASAHECRWICSDGATCPAGYGCGKDEVCRRGDGRFARLGEEVPLPAIKQLAAGDFDGDGAEDTLVLESEDSLGRRPAHILFSSGSSPQGGELGVPLLVGAIATAHTNLDAALDIAFTDVGGVGIIDGRADRKAEFAAFPSLVPAKGTILRAVPLEVIPALSGDELVTFEQAAPGTIALKDPSASSAAGPLATIDGDLRNLAGDVRAGRLDESSPCDTVVFGIVGANEVLLFTPCRDQGQGPEWDYDAVPLAVELPGTAKVFAGVQIVDLDLDTHLDLLIAGSDSLFAAWGKGDGTFTSDPGGAGVVGAAGLYALPKIAGVPGTVPLALADLNDDKIIDYVVPAGVVLSNGFDYDLAYATLGVPWKVAVVADFNANGLPDVAAASADALDVDFLNNAGGGLLNPAIVATEGRVEHLAAGDLDGDLVNDVVIQEAIDHDELEIDRVEIAFGAAHGPPAPPVLVATLGDVSEVYTGRLSAALGSGGEAIADGIEDIVAVATSGKASIDKLFRFRGNAARVATAELPLRTTLEAARPLGLAAGDFGAGAGLAALGVDLTSGNLHLWRIAEADEVDPATTLASAALGDGFRLPQKGAVLPVQYGAVMAAADLDKEGNDDVVLVAPYGKGQSSAALVFADYNKETLVFEPRPAQPIDLHLGARSSLLLRDVDADGRIDALLLGGAAGEVPGRALLLWGMDGGGLDTAHPLALDPAQSVTGIACLPLSTGAGCAPLLLTGTRVYRGAVTNHDELELDPIADLTGGAAIAVGDFDHDGVQDVAIGDADGLLFYRAQPERE